MKDLTLQAAELEKHALADIKDADSAQKIEVLRVKYLGKSGHLTCLLRNIVSAPVTERKALGKSINIAKSNVALALSDAKDYHVERELDLKLKQDKLDVTLPGTNRVSGSLHPITLAIRDLVSIFKSYGFVSVSGSEIEDDFHNFTALNIDELHPARAMHDTFYFSGDRLLRTHTSPAQIHTMLTEEPPLSMLSLGKVYRCDSDPTHSPMFHQLEGLVVSETCNFLELKALIDNFFSIFFQRNIEVRFRPSYFPFTEPSAEVDIRMSPESPWLEVMGCGMVHPNVFNHVKIDPKKYRGYAFGVGIDRLAMLKYGINDLRLFFENDIDFLAQF